jgi:spore coat protein H
VPAPRCNFAHVTVTTVDGPTEVTAVDKIYTHVDSIKDPFLRRNFGSDAGRLYEGTLSDFWPGAWQGTIEPKTMAAAADTTEIIALLAVLEDPGLTDPQRLTAIQGLVAYDEFLTFWAAEGLTGHWDGYADDQNNYWFYVNPADGLMHFIPWGPDATFGPGNQLPVRTGDPVHAEAIVPRAALVRRLFEIATSRADFLTELQRQLDDVFDEAELHAEIDRIEALMFPVTGDISTAINAVQTWIDAHRALVQAEINSPPTGFGGQPVHFCDAF